ncbi:hypothetical protein LCGC14_0984100 [marine sediment metagenome]|uniref:Uncharacterized protein n=1 Tax=marine sediment metagenome TaxID=412755 RepID=A0A0F9REC7_9ZZZZ
MGKLRTPFEITELSVKPPLSSSPNITDDIQQTLATLVAYNGQSRRLLRCTAHGMLEVVNPLAVGFINVVGSGVNDTYDGIDRRTSEVIVRAHPDNNSLLWLNVFKAAAVDSGWPLAANEYLVLSVNDISHLHLLIVGSGEKAVISYTQ